MLIEKINFINFRQYKDETIEFATNDPEKNFTIIQGSNGSGKTNILNAITWCFYAKELHLLKEKYKGLPIYNLMAAKQLKPGQIGYVEVKIHMRDEDNGLMIFSRRLKFKKENDKIIFIRYPESEADDGSDFRMMRLINKDMKEIADPEYILSMMIPQPIEEYFFFDGERLDDYFTELSGERIKEAVFNISQLGLLEKATKHLEDRKRFFLQDAKGLGSQAEDLRKKQDAYSASLKELKEQIDIKMGQKNKAADYESEYSEKLRNCPIKNISELENDRITATIKLEKLKQDAVSHEKEKTEYLLEDGIKIFAWKPIKETLRLIDGKKEAGDIPTKYKRYFLDNLLKDGICICGSDISELALNQEHRQKILKLQRECNEITNLSEQLMQLHADLRSILREIDAFPKKQKLLADKTNGLENSIRENTSKLQRINNEIAGTDVEQIKEWEHKLKEYRSSKERYIEEIAEDKIRIKAINDKIAGLGKDLEKELKKEKKHEELRKILVFCDESLRAANGIKNGIMDMLRKEIEEKTKIQFFNLIWKKETYKDVKINENYDVSILHESGEEGFGTLSAGERQVLALSFMAALNSVSGFNVPIIIDTPLGNISKEPKKNIASNLPNYLKGKQVTMLVTEEEYSLEVRERLRERVGREYKIKFEETSDGSQAKVIPYE
jgi:DNA sulfur modification protein DndD